MNFISFSFLLFLVPCVLARVLFGRFKIEPLFVIVILAASTVFCSWQYPLYLLVMLYVITVDFFLAICMAEYPKEHRNRKRLLWASIASNLAVLIFFKYTNFLLSLSADLMSFATLKVSAPTLDLILPMGISFYTFCAMSYCIDVYRGKLMPLRSFKEFYFFLTFFPHLVAGPIVRPDQFLYQIPRQRRLSLRVFNHAMYLIVRGYFLKMVCADNLGQFVNHYWDIGCTSHIVDEKLPGLVICFSMQIFCDFEGYSSIARGLAYLFGYRLPENFNNPYIADSFAGFWRRWHISLSEWLRDYLFIPIGLALTRGPLRGKSMQAGCWATLATMSICGLWHGANLTFVLWGVLHGILLCFERLLGFNPTARKPLIMRIFWALTVQAMVLIAWIFFRSSTVSNGWAFTKNMISGLGWHWTLAPGWLPLCLLPPVAMHLHGFLVERGYGVPLNVYTRAMLTGILLFLTLTFFASSTEFMYFKF